MTIESNKFYINIAILILHKILYKLLYKMYKIDI